MVVTAHIRTMGPVLRRGAAIWMPGVERSPAGWTWFVRPRLFAKVREEAMRKWSAPRIVEIAVGMEINCYACATL
jgi:coenzyme PQQ precursor peptide PqqA